MVSASGQGAELREQISQMMLEEEKISAGIWDMYTAFLLSSTDTMYHAYSYHNVFRVG